MVPFMERLSYIFNFNKKLLKKIIIFIVFFILTDLAIGIFYRNLSSYVSSFWQRRYLKVQHTLTTKYDYLIIGSSKSMYSINPKILNNKWNLSGYNASIEASDIRFYIDYIQMLKEVGNLPRNIIFNILPRSIEVNSINKSNVFNILGPQSVKSRLYKELFPIEYHLGMLNSLRYHKALPDLINGLRKKDSPKDFGFRPLTNLSICKKGITCKEGESFNKDEWAKERLDLKYTFKYLDQFLEIAKENSINVVFVESPIYSVNHIELAKDFYYLDLINKYLTGKNHKVYDYRSHKKFLMKDNLYSDLIHLNESGAIEFSNLISNDILLK
jgi:hypothetical protein